MSVPVPKRQVGAAVCSGASLRAYKTNTHISNMFYNVPISQYTFTYVSYFFHYVGCNIRKSSRISIITLPIRNQGPPKQKNVTTPTSPTSEVKSVRIVVISFQNIAKKILLFLPDFFLWWDKAYEVYITVD